MRKNKILYVATVDSHIKSFHLPYLKMMHDKGWEVHVATNGKEKFPYCDKKHTICMERNPFKLKNLKAIKQMKELLKKGHFDIIHCHTPMGSVVTRIAARQARENGTRVIYTAHGFHFYTGAPLINWLLFYPVEKYLAKYTDTLITINQEDYNRAKKKFSKRCRDIQYVPGVGIDPEKFSFKMTTKEKHELRISLGLKDDDFVMIFPAEISKRKKQLWLIKTLEPLLKEYPKMHLLLPGKDSLNGKCQNKTNNLKIQKQIHFLGFRNDIPRLLQITNLAVSSSRQEGLPVNLLEAAYCNIPIVATDCRGNRDICKNANSFIIKKEDNDGYRAAIETVYKKKENIKNNTKMYHLQNIIKCIYNIYFINPNNILMSFGIPCFNSEKTIVPLLNCFDSNCSFSYEIIIVDDGSTDETHKKCKYFINKHPEINIRLVYKKNGGVSSARNTIIKLAKGKWITFVDSDDLIVFDQYKSLISKGLDEKYDLVLFSNKIKHFSNNPLHKLISKEIINSPCCKFYRKKIIEDNKITFPDGIDLGEDLLFNLEYYAACKTIRTIKSMPYRYNKNASTLTKKYRENKYEELMKLNLLCKNILIANGINNIKTEKSLEFIKTKNCISCVRSYMGSEAKTYLTTIRMNSKQKYMTLNSFMETAVYYIWHHTPNNILLKIIREL